MADESESPRPGSAGPTGTSEVNVEPREAGHDERGALDHHVRKLLEALQEFLRERGQTALASKVLRIGDNDVSAEQLWMPVMHAGGFEAVSSQKCWAAIGRHFNPPKNMTDLSHKVKKAFEQHLLPFELAVRKGEVEGVRMPEPDPTLPKSLKVQKRHLSGGEASRRQSTKRSKGTGKARDGGQSYVGRRLLVKMSCGNGGDDALYIGTITAFKKDQHHVEFDDGDSEDVNLAEEVWRFATEEDEREAAQGGGCVALKNGGAACNLVPPASTVRADTQCKPSIQPVLAPPSLPLATAQPQVSSDLLDQHQRPAKSGPSAAVENVGVQAHSSKSDMQSHEEVIVQGEGFKVRRSTDDGVASYEIYVLATGMTKDDVKVKCWPEGRVRVKATPQKEIQNWTEEPIERDIHLPTAIDPHSAKALITLHGLLFIKVLARENIT